MSSDGLFYLTHLVQVICIQFLDDQREYFMGFSETAASSGSFFYRIGSERQKFIFIDEIII